MTAASPDQPAPRRARATSSCTSAPEDLRGCLEQLYVLVGPPATTARTAVQRRLRRDYLRDRADFERVCWYVADHVGGVRATLHAAASDPDASALLGPEALLVLERLDADPFGLHTTWPQDETMRSLLALADANARPLD